MTDVIAVCFTKQAAFVEETFDADKTDRARIAEYSRKRGRGKDSSKRSPTPPADGGEEEYWFPWTPADQLTLIKDVLKDNSEVHLKNTAFENETKRVKHSMRTMSDAFLLAQKE